MNNVRQDTGIEMTPELVALAHRVVSYKGWRWIPGMMRLRVTSLGMRDHLRKEGRVPEQFDNWAYDDWPVIPDLSDPATVGCLLALVREACKCPEAHVYWATVSRLWVVRWGAVGLGEHTVDAHTEVKALVRALEAANELPELP